MHYKAGYKYLNSSVHAQLLDFPAAITWAPDLNAARQVLSVALTDAAEAAVASGGPLPVPNPTAIDAEMDVEESIYLHLAAGTS